MGTVGPESPLHCVPANTVVTATCAQRLSDRPWRVLHVRFLTPRGPSERAASRPRTLSRACCVPARSAGLLPQAAWPGGAAPGPASAAHQLARVCPPAARHGAVVGPAVTGPSPQARGLLASRQSEAQGSLTGGRTGPVRGGDGGRGRTHLAAGTGSLFCFLRRLDHCKRGELAFI